MGTGFFARLGYEEKHDIKGRTAALTTTLEEWAARYPLVRPARIPSVALLTATVLPWVCVADGLLMAKLTLWVFGIDDVVDERQVTLAELQREAQGWCSIVDGGSSSAANGRSEPAAMLLETVGELAQYRLYEALHGYWSSSARSLFAGMIQEVQYGLRYSESGARALPPLDEYLGWGLYSISVPLWAAAALIVLGDPCVARQLEPMDRAIKCAGIAIRLFNDLRTFDKEVIEGKVSSVLIVYHTLVQENERVLHQEALSEAKERVARLAHSFAYRCYDSIGQIRTRSGQFERALSRLVAFNAYFYTRYDYHALPAIEVDGMLGGIV